MLDTLVDGQNGQIPRTAEPARIVDLVQTTQDLGRAIGGGKDPIHEVGARQMQAGAGHLGPVAQQVAAIPERLHDCIDRTGVSDHGSHGCSVLSRAGHPHDAHENGHVFLWFEGPATPDHADMKSITPFAATAVLIYCIPRCPVDTPGTSIYSSFGGI